MAGIEPPVNVTVDVVVVTAPPQVVVALPATTTPIGSVSISGAVRLAAVGLVLLNVIVRVEIVASWMVGGLKAFPSVTAEGAETVKVAMAGAALLPLLVCNAPAAIESM